MIPNHVPPLAPGCPWADWTRPNVKWCEDNLCEWITTPANTWSNLFYFVAAYMMLCGTNEIAASRQGVSGNAAPIAANLHLFAPATVAVGATSFAYHASYAYAFQVADFWGMFCFAALPFFCGTWGLSLWYIFSPEN